MQKKKKKKYHSVAIKQSKTEPMYHILCIYMVAPDFIVKAV